MKLLIELDEEYVKAIDEIRFLVGGRTDRKLQLEIIKAIKNGKALEQEPILDKLKAEIEQLPTSYVEIFTRHSGVKYRDMVELGAVTRIFDKYRAESGANNGS